MRWLDRRWQDVRYSVRTLQRSPVFALVAVIVLSLGIGVNAALFSVINAVFFRPLGVRAPEQLVYVYQNNAQSREFFTGYDDVLFLREHPYVFSGVGATAALPVFGGGGGAPYISDQLFRAGNLDTVSAALATVTAGYFDAMAIPMRVGGDFREADGVSGAAPVAIVSEALAVKLFPNGGAIGRSIAFFPTDRSSRAHPNWMEVVGVVGEIDPLVQARGSMPFVYRPGASIGPGMGTHLVVATAGDPAALAPALKRAALAADPEVEVTGVQTMEQIVGQILFPRRAAAGILSVSGLVGLLLAAVGLYGVIWYPWPSVCARSASARRSARRARTS